MTTSISGPRLRSLLRQATRVARSGKRAAGETLYRQIVEEAPDSADGWLGLAELTTDQDEQMSIYHKVLTLDPDNERAQAGLRGEELPTLFPPVEYDDEEEAKEEPAPKKHQSYEAMVLEKSVDDATAVVDETDLQTACYRHPEKKTSLRCYDCNNPICIKCANKTPVGYLCPDCKRKLEDTFYNSKPADYLISFLVALPLSLIIGYLVVRFSAGLSFFAILFMGFIAGAVGGFIGRVVKRSIGKRRGRYIPHVVATCVAVGVILPSLFLILSFNLFALIGPGIYLFVATSSAFFWVK